MIGSKIISLRKSLQRDLRDVEEAALCVRTYLAQNDAYCTIPKTHHLRIGNLSRIADAMSLLAELENLQDGIQRGACDCPPCVSVNEAARRA